MNKKQGRIPNRKEALELLERVDIPLSVKKHSIKVAKKALKIADKITKSNLNRDLVEAGALLHDIGRSETHGFEHALIGGEIIRSKGLSENLARVCETHILGGLDEEDASEIGLPERNYLPQTIEEKIVCLADKYVLGDQIVSIDERFDKWFNMYGKTKILQKSKKRIEQIQAELSNLM